MHCNQIANAKRGFGAGDADIVVNVGRIRDSKLAGGTQTKVGGANWRDP